MAEYIEREALREVIVNLQFSKHLNKAASLNLMHRAVDNLPAADVVSVARCRECKHHREKNKQEKQYLVEDILICTSPDVTDDCWSAVWPDHFCSYGERKEGAE